MIKGFFDKLTKQFHKDEKDKYRELNQAGLMQKAGQGDVNALYELGCRSAHGHEMPKNEEKSYEYFLKAAEGGHPFSQFLIGSCYVSGQITKKDRKKGFEWLLKASNGGVPDAQYQIAMLYIEGNPIPKDLKTAFEWLKKSAEEGNCKEAYVALSSCYGHGEGVEQDDKSMVRCMWKASELGDEKCNQLLRGMFTRNDGNTWTQAEIAKTIGLLNRHRIDANTKKTK